MRNKVRIMVCVTQQKSCKRLIEKGAKLKKHEQDDIHVVHVVKENWKYFGKLKEADALEYLFDSTKEYNANLSVIKAQDIEDTLKNYALKNKINLIVMGESLEKSAQQNMITRLQSKGLGDVKFEVVPLEEPPHHKAG